MKTANVSRVWLVLAFIAIYFVWGTTYLANLYALKSLPPFIISALRYVVAGLVLAILALGKKQAVPHGAEIRDLAISGILMLVGGSGLVVVAEQYISSGSAAVIVATEPLWFVVLDYSRWRLYWRNKQVIAGLLLGFIGIVVFTLVAPESSSPAIQSEHILLGTMIVVAASVLWVLGTLFAARRIEVSRYTLWHPTIQLVAAGFFAGLIALADGAWSGFALQAVDLSAWLGLGFLIVFGSLIAYLAFGWLVTVQPPALVSTHTYVNPLVAVLVGWLVAGEPVTSSQLLALTVVLTGVILTQLSSVRTES